MILGHHLQQNPGINPGYIGNVVPILASVTPSQSVGHGVMAIRHWDPKDTAKALRSGALPELIGRDAICALTGWTRAMLEVRSRTGKFPEPVVLPPTGALRWKTDLVAQWLRDHGIKCPPKPVSWRGPQPWKAKPYRRSTQTGSRR